MKKSLIALAIAGAMTAPIVAQADATLYGVAQFRLIDEDNSDLEAQMAKTRLGVKGTVDNDIEGLVTGYQFEWEFDGNGNTNGANTSSASIRKSHVYMQGDFGTLDFGRQNNPAASVKKADILGRNSAALTALPDRIGSAITYVTPTMGGFNAYGGVIADAGDSLNGENVDAYTVGGNFSAGSVDVALSYFDVDEIVDISSVGASFSTGGFYVGGSYQYYDADNGGDSDYYQVAASYTIDKTTLSAQYEDVSDTLTSTVGSVTEDEKVAVRAAYALGSSAGVAIEYADYDEGNDNLVLEYTLSF